MAIPPPCLLSIHILPFFAGCIVSLDEYDLLIIDDLGVERSTDYAMEQMFFVIDSRCLFNKSIFQKFCRCHNRRIFYARF